MKNKTIWVLYGYKPNEAFVIDIFNTKQEAEAKMDALEYELLYEFFRIKELKTNYFFVFFKYEQTVQKNTKNKNYGFWHP